MLNVVMVNDTRRQEKLSTQTYRGQTKSSHGHISAALERACRSCCEFCSMRAIARFDYAFVWSAALKARDKFSGVDDEYPSPIIAL